MLVLAVFPDTAPITDLITPGHAPPRLSWLSSTTKQLIFDSAES